MITYLKGSVFNTNAEAIVNTVNCTGIMGAGIALEYKLRYPKMFDEYKRMCEQKIYKTGNVYYYHGEEKVIINFPTKWHFKYPSKIEWIEAGLKNFCETYKQHNIMSVAFPRLGTNNGGLDWKEVQALMEKYLSKVDADVFICLDSLSEAEGVELEMVNKFNSIEISDLSSQIKLNKNQKAALMEAKTIKRFREIGNIQGIGVKAYSELFNYFYDMAINKDNYPEQLSILDMMSQ